MRLFFALRPAARATECLATIADEAATSLGGKPTRRETIHLTLAFLGEIAEARILDVLATGNALRASAFDLSIDRLGLWRHNHLVWAGCSSVPAGLSALAGGLGDALSAAGFAFDNKRPFAPHVTLVRKIPDFVTEDRLPRIDPIAWECSDFLLMHSRPSAAGPAYEVLAGFPLTADD